MTAQVFPVQQLPYENPNTHWENEEATFYSCRENVQYDQEDVDCSAVQPFEAG